MTIILAGTIGRSVTGGQAWASMQYLAGLSELGHDVFYLEDCGETSWVYNWDAGEWTDKLDYPAAYVGACLKEIGFEQRWIYRAGELSAGMNLSGFLEVCARAELLILRAVPLWIQRPEYTRPARRVFIDVDPGFTQLNLAGGDEGLKTALSCCERLFTLGQRVGEVDCPVPLDRPWLKTLPPVSLTHWPVAAGGPATHFTSIMRWQGFQDATHEGVSCGQKDKEFLKFLELPRLSPQPFLIALNGPEFLAENGWDVVPGEVVSKTPSSYRKFIQESRAEFGVAKQGYVMTQPGWFSDRSVCYLASGRPILIQDTGLSDWLPIGEGVLTFSDLAGAVAGIKAINARYEHHRRAAREVAENYFAAEKVLPPLLEAAMN